MIYKKNGSFWRMRISGKYVSKVHLSLAVRLWQATGMLAGRAESRAFPSDWKRIQ